MNNKDIQLSKSLTWLLRHGAVREGFRLRAPEYSDVQYALRRAILTSTVHRENLWGSMFARTDNALTSLSNSEPSFRVSVSVVCNVPEGFLDVSKILQHKTFKGKYSTSDIERVVNNNDKQRFKLRQNPSSNCLEIKANQGHTITDVLDADLTPITEAKYNTVIHGTYLKCWPQIKYEGINRMKRNHIHLAKGTLEDASVISGLRQDTEVHIYINLAGALADAVKFYESENGVILTSGNEKGYLEPKYFARAVNIHTGEHLYP